MTDFLYHLTVKSGNAKVGPIPVSTTSENSCGDCPLRCYARKYHLAMHWRKVSSGERGIDLETFCQRVEQATSSGAYFRHNQAGDLPHEDDGRLIMADCLAIAQAASYSDAAWTYTHHTKDKHIGHNVTVLRAMAEAYGFVVNLSAGFGDLDTMAASLSDVDRLAVHGLPVAVCIPRDVTGDHWRTPAGRPVSTCLAQTGAADSCHRCARLPLCAIEGRRVVIAFRDHS